MILWYTILDRIKKVILPEDDIRFIDIRYLDKWINKYPQCFPTYVINKNYVINFIPEKLRYELKPNK